MKYYFIIKNNDIKDCANLPIVDEGAKNIEITEEQFNIYKDKGLIYFKYEDDEIIINPDYEALQEQIECERINMFSLTAADVERAIYKVKGLDFDDILELVKDNPSVDAKALKIELKANNFYRGNPYVSTIGNLLGFTEEQLDKFFETGNYEELM